ncbi:NAD-dependent epimerase/dehydratase family protein [Mesorhizobium atlanticum]
MVWVEHGYTVLNVDVQISTDPVCPFYKVDLNDLGQVIDALQWSGGKDHPFRKFRTPDAVVHLAAIPAPDLMPDDVIFRNNIVTTYNVFDAAIRVGVKRIVWASSRRPPWACLSAHRTRQPTCRLTKIIPCDRKSAYSLSKDLGEEMARQMQRWNPGTTFIGLRLSNVMEPSDYERFSSWQEDPHVREWNCWGYIDARDCAQAVRKALHVELVGADHFIIANANTVMEQESAELMKTVFPNVQFKREIGGRETLLSIDKARRVLGYEPEFNFGRNLKISSQV